MPISLSHGSIPKQLSWNLTIDSTIVVVTGSMTIGSVMVQLVNSLDISQDFSDYALWWPKANIWLTNTKWSLDQYGVQSDAYLNFTSMHKPIRLQLPDLRVLTTSADFSVSVFAAVCKLCKDLGIRHAEELSLLYSPKVANGNTSSERRTSPRRRRRNNTGTLNRHNSMGDSLANNTSTVSTLFSPTTPKLRSAITNEITESTMRHPRPISHLSKSLNSLDTNFNGNLARTPVTPVKDVLSHLTKPINLIEKSKLNGLWYDSSKSLMEQNTYENDIVLLRFKYFTFYDLNSKLDAIRLNQLFEQAKWSILSEDIDCTEEEMMNFAALQLQIQIQSHQATSTSILRSSNNDIGHEYDNANDYDIDRALERLQDSLLGTNITNTNQSTNTLLQKFSSNSELSDYLRLVKPRKFAFKTFKRYWFIMRDNQLTYFINESQQRGTPIEKISLKGCEILPHVHVSSKKYAIRLMIPSIDGMNETLIRCSTDEQYAKWMAAFRLASKGRSINEPSYETERESILALLNMQRPLSSSSSSSSNNQQTKFDIQPENFVSTKFVKKYKTKQLTERILEAHAAVSNLDGIEAKLQYLKAWQALPEFGITTFIVKFKDSNKKEELLGIASNRLLRMTLTGDTIKTWWISRMRSWNVNWENKLVTIEFDGETIHFLPLYGIESKCIHEFIGAYIFLSMRSTMSMSDNNDPIHQETLFQRLTAAYN